MTKKLILLLATCLLVTSCLFGCGDDTKPSDDNPTTTEKVETTTKEDVATTEPTTAEPTTPPETTTQEPTTEEPTTPEETEEYVYMGTKVYVPTDKADFFNGLVLKTGDVIYINEIFPEESEEYDGARGSLVYAFYAKFKMNKELEEITNKYWTEATQAPLIPYKDNYCIRYTGEDIEFIYGENRGTNTIFDAVPLN